MQDFVCKLMLKDAINEVKQSDDTDFANSPFE